MATVYKIEIETVSPWCSFKEEYIQQMFEKFLKEYKDKENNQGFENTTVVVKKIA